METTSLEVREPETSLLTEHSRKTNLEETTYSTVSVSIDTGTLSTWIHNDAANISLALSSTLSLRIDASRCHFPCILNQTCSSSWPTKETMHKISLGYHTKVVLVTTVIYTNSLPLAFLTTISLPSWADQYLNNLNQKSSKIVSLF